MFFVSNFVTRYRMPKVSVRPPHMEQRRMYFLDMVRQKQEAGRSATLTPLYPHGTVDMPENNIFMLLRNFNLLSSVSKETLANVGYRTGIEFFFVSV